MQGASSLRFSTQAQADIRRITSELTDLQAQMASGRKASDLVGLGAATTPVLSAMSLKASLDNRLNLVDQLNARLDVQAISLRKATESAQQLAQEIRTAISAGDGRGIGTSMRMAFNGVVQAMNETWSGQPMFAGERQDVSPVTVSTVEQLEAAPSVASVFNESARDQVMDLGDGLPVQVSAKASTLSTGFLSAVRDLQALISGHGGQIGQPIDSATETQLLSIVSRLDASAKTFVNEEARVGQLQTRFDSDKTKLIQQTDLMAEEVSKHSSADLAEVSIKLNTLMTQYQAAAKTFADLSKLTLLDYL